MAVGVGGRIAETKPILPEWQPASRGLNLRNVRNKPTDHREGRCRIEPNVKIRNEPNRPIPRHKFLSSKALDP
jgi:hypothetical protein